MAQMSAFESAIEEVKCAYDEVDRAYGEERLQNMKLREYVDFLEEHIMDFEFVTEKEAKAFVDREHKKFLGTERGW
jgi:hypothetical protein